MSVLRIHEPRHCGVARVDGETFDILNDESVELIAKTAVHMQKRAPISCPQRYDDGRIGAVRVAARRGRF